MMSILKRLVRSAGPLLTLGLVFATPLLAQEQAAFGWHGLLHDSAGAPIADAKVKLTGAATAEANTGADGSFTLSALRGGQYRLAIIAEGKTAAYAQAITLASDAPPVVITLSSRGEITVAAQQGTGATGGEALSGQAVSSLPLNGRDFSTLLLLAAGTMTDTNGATNFTQQFAINGQRGVEATFAMDGADISDPEMGGSIMPNFNVDAIQELQSSSGWMPADIGRGASGFTNIITRSGAAGFHGSFFEFVRNSAFDARNFFDHPTPAYPGRIPPFRRNEFGFTNGGPVYIPHLYDGRKRTFYFTEYQGFRQVLGTTQVMPIPTAAQRPSGGSNIVSDTVSFPDGINRFAGHSGESIHCCDTGSISAAESSYWFLRCEYLRDRFEGDHQRRPILVAHRPQAFSKEPVLRALHDGQPDGTDDKPGSDSDRSRLRRRVPRSAAQRRRDTHDDVHAKACARVLALDNPVHPWLSYPRFHGPRGEV